jgi:hypothetical protein
MNTKSNKWFEETAADPARRRAAIGDMSKRCTILFWCAMVISACVIISIFASNMSGKPGNSFLIFPAAVIWSIVFKVESDLRLLQVIERLHGSEDEKPTA